jgi:hypothetical protein
VRSLRISRRHGWTNLLAFIFIDSPKARAGASSILNFDPSKFSHSLTGKLGATARAENLAFQSLRLLAVVVDVAIFLPLLLVHGSAPPHHFSTASRCFCAASAVFCRPGRRMTCIAPGVDRPCRRRAYAGPCLWGRACSALGCLCFDFDWWMATSGTLERGQPRQMTGTWSAAWEGVQWWCGEHSLAVFGNWEGWQGRLFHL